MNQGQVRRFLQRGGGYVAVQAALLTWVALAGLRTRRVRRGRQLIGAAASLSGLVLGVWSGRQLGRNLTALPEPVRSNTLMTEGAYGFIRHPIYSAVLLGSTRWSLLRGSNQGLKLTALLAVVFQFKSEYEEAALQERHPEYAAYRRKTRKFIPGVY